MSPWIKTPKAGVYKNEVGHYKAVASIKNPRTGKRTKREHWTDPILRTEEEAVIMRARLIEQIRAAPAQQSPRLTLGAYANRWMDQREQWLSPATARTYRGILADHIVPQLGDLYADVITRDDVLEWVQWTECQVTWQGDLYAQDTLRKWNRVLRTLLKDMAADIGIKDPTHRVRAPKSLRRNVREQRTLTWPELFSWLWALSEVAPQRYAEGAFMALTGARSGEVWALQVADVVGHQAHIHRTVSDGVIKDETKTGWERHAYLPQLVVDAVAAHRQRMLRRQHRGLRSGLLFPSNAGTPRTAGSIRKMFDKAAELVGIEQRVTPQVLRRTYISLMVDADASELVIRSQVGHSDQDMTDRYYFKGHLDAKKRYFEEVFEGVA